MNFRIRCLDYNCKNGSFEYSYFRLTVSIIVASLLTSLYLFNIISGHVHVVN